MVSTEVAVSCAVLVVAAGRGTRARGTAAPKQYVRIGDRAILSHALNAFLNVPTVDAVLAVIHGDDSAAYLDAVPVVSSRLLAPVTGGATRQASVLAGLRALRARGPSRVLIHDAARPFVEADTIGRVLSRLDAGDVAGVIAALPVVDTLKEVRAGDLISGSADRSVMWRAQTPQGFLFADILAAHEAAAAAGRNDFTDDAAVAAWHGLRVAVVAGSERNFKVTTADDVARAAGIAGGRVMEPRSGTGFDVHRFTAGDHVWLCGVMIPHTAALDGHSDADVGLHALTDALLGAIGDGDIGQHFPPSDPKWRGAASDQFLADARRRVEALGGRITNVDVTLLCEAPKISPHRDAMRARVADILGIEPSRVGVKATTTEQLGFTGRREGIAAMAAAMVMLPAG